MSNSLLSELTSKELQFLRKAISKGQLLAPVSEMALESVGKGSLYGRLGPLREVSRDVALALIDAALSSGSAVATSAVGGSSVAAVAGSATVSPVSLVWTGPEVSMSKARKTTAMLVELFASAKQEVLIVGYEFDHGAALFESVHRGMRERGVTARIFLDVQSAPSTKTPMDSYLALCAHRFMQRNWPFGAPVPALYYYPEAAANKSYRSLHAKCVVVDRRRVFVGSANFTNRGCTRNLEVGVCLDDEVLASTLVQQFDSLVDNGCLAILPAPAAARASRPEDVEEEGSGRSVVAASPFEAMADELLVSRETRELFMRIVAQGLPAPVVGDDVEDDDGAVIGSPEFHWPEQKVAVLLPEQLGSLKALQGADWVCFTVPLGEESFGALCEAIAREA